MKTNLGKTERWTRFALGLTLGTVALTTLPFGLPQTALLVCSIFLLLNAALARCYLWKWLGLNSPLTPCRGLGALARNNANQTKGNALP